MPFACVQLNPWRPSSLTSMPHGQLCGWHSGDPSLNPHAILKLALSSFNPNAGIGIAFSQSDECSAVTALNHDYIIENYKYKGYTKQGITFIAMKSGGT